MESDKELYQMKSDKELKKLRAWWMENSRLWFDSTESDDIDITNKFSSLIGMDFDLEDLISNFDIEIAIGYIILQDQIRRHIKRAKSYLNECVENKNENIENKLDMLIGFVKKFYQLNKLNLSGYDFCFVLLPLRHSNIFELQMFVIKETWFKLEEIEPNTQDSEQIRLIQIYRNYLKATYERASKGNIYQVMYHGIYQVMNQGIYQVMNQVMNQSNWNCQERIEEFVSMYLDILDPSCHHYKSKLDITNNLETNQIIKTCQELKKNFPPNIILSISGGIDSMCLSYIFALEKINFVMIHINYSNRGEICEKEKDFLKLWARYLGVELYIRDIEEINRPKCMKWDLRNLYESYTRDARYQAYLDVANEKNWNSGDYGIVLGHNHDDCIENILTNITNKTKYDNLYGMEFKSFVNFKLNTLCFLRPMLTISKEQIYWLAHLTNIPYLFDSTPKWSQRGQIRDIIRPALISWNKSSLDGLDELVKVISESFECVDMMVEYWFNKLEWYENLDKNDKIDLNLINKRVSPNPFKIIKIKINEIKLNKIFWLKFLQKLNYNLTCKNTNELVIRITNIKNKFEHSQPKQLAQIQINKEKKIYYWKTLDNNIIFGFSK